MTSFGPIAEHYDVLMSHVPYDMWVGYYQLLLAQMDVNPRKLLDVCCGTGLVAELLAQEGYEVTGFDLSEPMVQQARAKAAKLGLPLRYEVADAATVDLGETFAGAYSFFDSLNYITEPTSLSKAIGRVARHLEPGGTFVFDVNTAYAFEQRMFDQRERSPKAPIRYKWEGDYDPKSRIIRVSMEFERDGHHFQETHVQRAHTQEEIVQFLNDAGFEEVRAYDSYTLDPPRAKSDRLHYTARRG
ncbi:MAG: methyltransferase domain-containing protein [Armatimonadetes bacterium]|nr:methyltransferase domain-containing protein [Armatimonadota bacterium]